MSTDFPVVPGGELPPAPRKRNWTVIILVVAGVLMLCTLVCCVGMIFGAPQLGGWSASVMCQAQYPDLGEAKCKAWGDDMFKNHVQEFNECNQSAQAGGVANPNVLFQCLDEKGIGPKSK